MGTAFASSCSVRSSRVKKDVVVGRVNAHAFVRTTLETFVSRLDEVDHI
jgi:hypothetical protein